MTMRLDFRVKTLIALTGLLLCPLSARASQVIVGNLNQTVSSNSPSVIDPSDFWAQEFTSGVAATLQSVDASLGNFAQAGSGDFALTAQLFQVSSASNTPDMGSLVATLTQNGAIPTAGYANVEFDAAPSVLLNPNAFYWFVLSASSGDGSGLVDWQFTDSPSNMGPGSLPNVASMSTFFPNPPWSLFPAETPFLVQVNGEFAAVPEPSSLILGCAGFSAVLFATSRSRSRRARQITSK
jgi:hypothetical protein